MKTIADVCSLNSRSENCHLCCHQPPSDAMACIGIDFIPSFLQLFLWFLDHTQGFLHARPALYSLAVSQAYDNNNTFQGFI